MIIYKTTNIINGKIYIGQDSKNNKNYLGGGILIKKALLKYGKENFIKEIIEYCNNKNELNEREIYWIEFFNATDHTVGYNIETGGNAKNHSDETRKKIGDSKRGKSLSFEHKLNIGIASANRTESTHLKLSESRKKWKLSKSTTDKIVKTRRENKQKLWESIVILQFDVNDNFINEWKNIYEIVSSRDFSKKKTCKQMIQECLSGKRNYAYNHIWKIKE